MADTLKLLDHDQILIPLQEAARDFAEGEIFPLDAKYSKLKQFPDEMWKKFGEQGYLGVTAPEEFGGMNLGYLPHFVITEEISRCSGSIGLSYIADSNLCVNQITLNGTPEQKAKYLPYLISGEYVGALAMSEVDHGSDVITMEANVKDVEGGYLANGAKFWITNGERADVVVVYFNSAPGKITAFLVEKGMEGFKIGQTIDKIGMNASETRELVFENCFIPVENMLGELHKGSAVLMSGLNYERLILSAGAIGIAQAAYEDTLIYTGERVQGGKPIRDHQAVAFDLAQMSADIAAARSLAYTTAADLDERLKTLSKKEAEAVGDLDKLDAIAQERKALKYDKEVNADCARVFLIAGQVAENVTAKAIKLQGGYGYTTESRAGRQHNDGMLYQIGGGTENIRKLIIARAIGCNI